MASFADSLKPKAGEVAKGLKFPGAAKSEPAAEEEPEPEEGEAMSHADMGRMLIKAVKLGDAEAACEAVHSILRQVTEGDSRGGHARTTGAGRP